MPGEEITFTARPKINSHSQIFMVRPKHIYYVCHIRPNFQILLGVRCPWVRLFSKTVVLTRFYKTKCSGGISGAVVVQHSCCLKVMLAALKKSITELKDQFAPFPIYHPCMFEGCFFHISTAKKHCGQTNLLKLSSPIVLCL